MAFLAAATDGSDGSTDAAGAVVDGRTVAELQAKGVDVDDALRRFDSHPALGSIGARIETGPTDTNVTDLHLLAVEGRTAARKKK